MCKILITAGLSTENIDNFDKFIDKIKFKMSVANADGLGYAALNQDGKLYGERWFKNTSAYKERTLYTGLNEKMYDSFSSFIKPPETEYNYFGFKDEKELNENKPVAYLLHTRNATNEICIENTHPFVEGNNALIHNGVIYNHAELTTKYDFESTCDSESILKSYMEHKVNVNPKNINAALNELDGWFACGVFSTNEDDFWILDVFKSSASSLHGAFIKELDTYVFTTSKYDLKDTIQELNWTSSEIFEVNSLKHLRIEPFSGNVTSTTDFKYESKPKKTGVQKSVDEFYSKFYNTKDTPISTEKIVEYLDEIIPDIGAACSPLYNEIDIMHPNFLDCIYAPNEWVEYAEKEFQDNTNRVIKKKLS